MEEQQAHELYSLFQNVHQSAKRGRGLGFSDGASDSSFPPKLTPSSSSLVPSYPAFVKSSGTLDNELQHSKKEQLKERVRAHLKPQDTGLASSINSAPTFVASAAPVSDEARQSKKEQLKERVRAQLKLHEQGVASPAKKPRLENGEGKGSERGTGGKGGDREVGKEKDTASRGTPGYGRSDRARGDAKAKAGRGSPDYGVSSGAGGRRDSPDCGAFERGAGDRAAKTGRDSPDYGTYKGGDRGENKGRKEGRRGSPDYTPYEDGRAGASKGQARYRDSPDYAAYHGAGDTGQRGSRGKHGDSDQQEGGKKVKESNRDGTGHHQQKSRRVDTDRKHCDGSRDSQEKGAQYSRGVRHETREHSSDRGHAVRPDARTHRDRDHRSVDKERRDLSYGYVATKHEDDDRDYRSRNDRTYSNRQDDDPRTSCRHQGNRQGRQGDNNSKYSSYPSSHSGSRTDYQVDHRSDRRLDYRSSHHLGAGAGGDDRASLGNAGRGLKWTTKVATGKGGAGGNALDYSAMIPGYDDMTPAEKVKARMRHQLQQAHEKHRAADAVEAAEAVKEHSRFAYNEKALFDDQDEGFWSKYQSQKVVRHATASSAAEDAEILKAKQKQLAALRRADASHEEAIFGRPGGMLGLQEEDSDQEEEAGFDTVLHGKPSPRSASAAYGNGASEDNHVDHDEDILAVLSETVKSQQELSWRERAALQKQHKGWGL